MRLENALTIMWMVSSENTALAIYSLNRLDSFISNDCGGKLKESMWDSVGNILLRCLRNCELGDGRGGGAAGDGSNGGKVAFLLAEVIEKIGQLLCDNFESFGAAGGDRLLVPKGEEKNRGDDESSENSNTNSNFQSSNPAHAGGPGAQ